MISGNFIPKGAASYRVDYDGQPRDFYFLLLPRLTMLAFSAAVEPLRIANQVTGKELYRWFTMTEDGAPVTCSNLVKIVPDMALVPLSNRSMAFVCAGTEPARSYSARIIQWLCRQRAFGYSVGGICTGTFALASAGLLAGRRFTLHWENQPSFCELYPELTPTPNMFENDNGLLTCGGGNASTDMMLEIIETDHGKDLALVVADMCIHSRSAAGAAPQKSAYSVAYGSRNPRLIQAMQYMQDNLEDSIEIAELSERLQISRRQLERLFKRYAGMTPSQFFYDLRVTRARALLSETNLSVTEIAVATGFSSRAQLSTHFRRKYGVAPQKFRKGWGGQPSREHAPGHS